jgi:5-methylcytosine-specific restriction enzyme subunit McrC
MRTIQLREQEAVVCCLTRTEVACLRQAERANGRRLLSVGVRNDTDGMCEIRTGSIVGTVVWPDLQLLIRPKVDMRNVFFLLGFRGGLARWGEDPFRYEREANLLTALAWAFDTEVRRGLRYGIARGYISHDESLITLRGRIDIGRQLTLRQGRPLPVECRYEEYSADITLNRLIKAAQRRLRGIPGLGQELRRRLLHTGSAFADVSDIEFSAGALPSVHFTRLNIAWQAATQLALMILRAEAQRDEMGASIGTSFTVDMNILFEKFIEEVVCEEARRRGLECRSQARVSLTKRIEMRPDLVLAYGQRILAVGDAKYIELQSTGWPHANLYQLLAYCVGLGLPRGLLIYAARRPLEQHRVLMAAVDLEIVGIDMSRPSEEFVQQARYAAHRLVSHAQQALLRPLASTG